MSEFEKIFSVEQAPCEGGYSPGQLREWLYDIELGRRIADAVAFAHHAETCGLCKDRMNFFYLSDPFLVERAQFDRVANPAKEGIPGLSREFRSLESGVAHNVRVHRREQTPAETVSAATTEEPQSATEEPQPATEKPQALESPSGDSTLRLRALKEAGGDPQKAARSVIARVSALANIKDPARFREQYQICADEYRQLYDLQPENLQKKANVLWFRTTSVSVREIQARFGRPPEYGVRVQDLIAAYAQLEENEDPTQLMLTFVYLAASVPRVEPWPVAPLYLGEDKQVFYDPRVLEGMTRSSAEPHELEPRAPHAPHTTD